MNLPGGKGAGPGGLTQTQHGMMQKRSGGVNQSRDRTNVGFNSTGSGNMFNRPQSATQKRKVDGSQERNEQLNSGLRQLLQQNAAQNKEN